MRVRVMHVISPSGMYGAERVVLNWTDRLGADHAFSLAYFEKEGRAAGEFLEAMDRLGARSHPLPDSLAAMLRAARELARAARSERADLLHCHGYKAVALAGLSRPWHGLPVLVSQHGFVNTSAKLRLYNRLDAMVSAWGGADRVLCVSDQIADVYRRAGLPESRLVRLNNAVPVEPWPQAARPPQGPPPEGVPREAWRERVLACVGRLSPEKGQDVLIRAMPAILADHPRALLMLVGDGPTRQDLQSLAERLGVAERVVFAGFRTDAAEIMRRAEFLVLPSLTEGLPLVALEAMAMGKPAVASRVGGVPRLIEDGIHGLLVPAGDADHLAKAVRALLRDQERVRRMGREAWRRVHDDYNLDRQAEDISGLYLELARSKARSRLTPLRLVKDGRRRRADAAASARAPDPAGGPGARRSVPLAPADLDDLDDPSASMGSGGLPGPDDFDDLPAPGSGTALAATPAPRRSGDELQARRRPQLRMASRPKKGGADRP